MYTIKWSSRFKREYKRFQFNVSLIKEIDEVIVRLAKGEKLPNKYHDHHLQGQYKGCKECHIKPDLLLIYKQDKNELLLLLVRLGSHSQLF